MNEFFDEVLRKAGLLVAELRGRYEADDIDGAAGLVVAIIDLDGRQVRCYGPFPDPVAATAWAESHIAVLNQARSEGGAFTAEVSLLFDPGC